MPFTNIVDLLDGKFQTPDTDIGLLIRRMLSQNPEGRPTCLEILQHPKLASIALEVSQAGFVNSGAVKA
jgi:serine/threonine protein kinase